MILRAEVLVVVALVVAQEEPFVVVEPTHSEEVRGKVPERNTSAFVELLRHVGAQRKAGKSLLEGMTQAHKTWKGTPESSSYSPS